MPIEYMFCFIFRQTMHNNHFVAQKLHGFFSSAFKENIRNSTTATFQEVGGVIRPFIFCR